MNFYYMIMPSSVCIVIVTEKDTNINHPLYSELAKSSIADDKLKNDSNLIIFWVNVKRTTFSVLQFFK